MRISSAAFLLLSACSAPAASGPEPTRALSTKSATRCAMLDGGAPVSGTWEAITPPQVNLAAAGFGVKAFVIDPNDSATVYLGTHAQGIYKSSDCGSTWSHVNTGVNGSQLDSGRNWSMVIDPTDSSIYTCAGYGPSGVWKSTNGGVDWTQILTSNITSVAPYHGFIEWIAMDPSDPTHLIVTFHGPCSPPAPSACMAESKDSGATWNITGHPMFRSDKDGVYILSGATWLYGSWIGGRHGGIWRTTDGGASWTQVSTAGASASFYHSPVTGHLFVGGGGGMQESADDGVTWTLTPHMRTFSVTGSGTKLFASDGMCLASPLTPFEPYFSASETSPKWSSLASPLMTSGGLFLKYNTDQGLLYSSNCRGGFWRAWSP